METIRSLNTYDTDTYGSWGLGAVSRPSNWTYSQVLVDAIGMKANVIVKPSRGNWYIKGINNNKSYDEIKSHLEINEISGYKNKSLTRLLSYF
jgi:hypothetical protein